MPVIMFGASSGASMLQLIGEKSFGAFARPVQNGFVALTDCFMTVSRQTRAGFGDQTLRKSRMTAKTAFDSSMTSHA
ncbi:hypothetical protein [Bradyrhizobium sp. SZCCHNR1002]|uniref:hypothetical protein n=1 Tax=Bradyrhizobium sp. SZCCHNR1002 TaxID=3057334 RepID=UPI0028F15387|nr:hypothetical protein [Bradyrhizobium sp. SZCCHNR1002]